MKTWFSMKASTNSQGAETGIEISIFDEIGMWGVTAKDFIAELQAKCGGQKKAITVSINSPGGSVFDALAIYNSLRTKAESVTVRVIGVAASAASLIAMAGDKIIMPENTFLMIHNPWAFASGNADELRDFADTLDTIGASLVKTYVARTGLSEEEVKALLAAETWLSAEDALAKGFATEVEAALKIAASYDLDRFPANIKAIFDTAKNDKLPNGDGITDDPQATKITVIEIDTEDDSEDGTGGDDAEPADTPACTFADEIIAYAKTVGMSGYAAVVALDSTIKDMAEAKARLNTAREVSAICALAGKPEMADAFIKDGADLAKARVSLMDTLASAGDALVTSSIKPAGTDKVDAAGGSIWSKIFPTAAQK